jgi:hypothetical protein
MNDFFSQNNRSKGLMKKSNFSLCSIIVLNYNSKLYLKKCLDSFVKQTYPNFEVIVVDNASTDGSLKILKSFPKVRLIKNKSNLGFAGGNNVGIKKSKGEYVAIIDSDTIADKNWLSELVRVAETDKKIGVVGGKVYHLISGQKKSNILQYAGGKLHKFLNFYLFTTKRGNNKKDVGQYEKIKETDFVYGCAFLVKRSVINKVGLMDEKYFMYGEEIDWHYRIKEVGYKILYAPAARIWHFGSPGVGKVSYKKTFYIQRSNIRVVIKLFDLHWVAWYVFFSEPAHIFLKIIYGLFRKTLRDDLHAMYEAIKWNVENIDETLSARKKWLKEWKKNKEH